MQTSVRRSYQYYDYAGPIEFNNTRRPLLLQLDPGAPQQYPTREPQANFQQSHFQQLPLTEHQLNVHQHEQHQQQQQLTIVASEPQNFDCFLDATITTSCYSVQPQLELNSTPHLLNTPIYDDTSFQQCQQLNSHLLVTVDQPNEAPQEAEKQEVNLYSQQLHNETTNQPGYQHHTTAPTLYYEPSQLDGSNCGQLVEQAPIESSSYQLVVPAPLQQLPTQPEAGSCDYFNFQPSMADQEQPQLIHSQDSGKFNEQQHFLPSATFTSSHHQLSPPLHELFQPTANSFDTSRFLAASQSLDQQPQHHFHDQTRVADTQHYHELIKQPPANFSYLEPNTALDRRQTFEPSLASQEETQSSSAASISSSEESASSILTRDEKKAREANIPIAYNDIINLSIEQFNEQLSKYNLSESQLNLIKDIRRRGKNKVAAQSCRKRKMEQICELQHEVGHLSNRRKLLSEECNQLIETHDRIVQQYERVYSIIQEHLAAAQ